MLSTFRKRILGYLIKKLDVPNMYVALKRLRSMGFSPNLIFDIGAHEGDFADICLTIWSNSELACFDVIEDKMEILKKRFSSNNKVKAFPFLMGEENKKEVALHLIDTGSSILEEHAAHNVPKKSYEMKTIDSIVEEFYKNRIIDILKIDVQGYELPVLKGAINSLNNINVILLELNLIDIHKNVSLIEEIVKWLSNRNWVMYDICGIHRRPLDNAIWQIDAIFLKRDSDFRKDKRWGK
ncbi:FkbM family methyltransferase [Candidatus Omnitrophota bacterium]